jgi:hypothetical protein
MTRCDHARALGKAVEHGFIGVEANAGMQKQEWPSAALLNRFNTHAVD